MGNIKTDYMREIEHLDRINNVIQGQAIIKGISSPVKLAQKAGMAYSTFHKRTHNAGDYRLSELIGLGKIAGFEVRLYASGEERRIW